MEDMVTVGEGNVGSRKRKRIETDRQRRKKAKYSDPFASLNSTTLFSAIMLTLCSFTSLYSQRQQLGKTMIMGGQLVLSKCQHNLSAGRTDSVLAVLSVCGSFKTQVRSRLQEKELTGSLVEKKLPSERCTGRNSEWEKSSGQKKISELYVIKIYGSYEETKKKTENRKDWRKLGSQWGRNEQWPLACRNFKNHVKPKSEKLGSEIELRGVAQPAKALGCRSGVVFGRGAVRKRALIVRQQMWMQQDAGPALFTLAVGECLNLAYVGYWIG
ncbi:hypothetical protein ANN_02926 [Periplaneta americana]|uniref:Uncharacterized protein n=1 Tax=Periplaneta americana TaxID=6978 RepID=A0ABQ8TXN6_PERAM|nr:hypothetical protein ANN_02926 [Periplaneta americana]